MENEKKYLPQAVYSYEELVQIFKDFQIDSEKTRFYIGSDYADPKAFVIYQDDFDDYVVYKVKADGVRALRYKGKDEAYAVNEYYQKFLEEVRKRPEFARKLLEPQTKKINRTSSYTKKKSLLPFIILPIALSMTLIFSGIVIGSVIHHFRHRYDGYYTTPHGHYYYHGNDMYYYDNDDWMYYGSYDSFDDFYEYDDYTYSEDYYYNDDYSDFSESDYYYDDDDDYSWDSDDDSGWDSDDSWDSWDSGGTDWDSDW
jgi:hypothetical protein